MIPLNFFNMDNSNPPTDGTIAPEPGTTVMACRRCGVYCTRHQAFVMPDEIRRIVAYLGITRDDWERRFADPRWEYHDYRLIRHVDGACAFLTRDGALAGCAIQSVKPACCSEWAPSPDKKECRQGMERES